MAPSFLEASQEDVEKRRIIDINAETVTNIPSTNYPGTHYREDHSWSLEKFTSDLKIQIHRGQPYHLEFSLIGVDAPIANAFRRILISEIPTLAIEDVFIANNTSIIQDEVLAARLGLIPLKGNKTFLSSMDWTPAHLKKHTTTSPSDTNTVVLHLKATCTFNPSGGKEKAKTGETDLSKIYSGHNVYASQMIFDPKGRQAEFFTDDNKNSDWIRPVQNDVLIAKMRPGENIDLTMHAVKGLGSDHAKFSPVAPASYRLLPSIEITQPILGQDARKFARCFPRGVIGLEPISKSESSLPNSPFTDREGDVKAVVREPMKDTVSRECLRHEEFKDKVKLGRVRDHFIFNVESSGQFESEELFLESMMVLKMKCKRVKRDLDRLIR